MEMDFHVVFTIYNNHVEAQMWAGLHLPTGIKLSIYLNAYFAFVLPLISYLQCQLPQAEIGIRSPCPMSQPQTFCSSETKYRLSHKNIG